MATLVRHRQYVLVFVMLYSIAFPWTCMRHCAQEHAQHTLQIQFVCNFQLLTQTTRSEVNNTTVQSVPVPILVQFVHVSSLLLSIVLLIRAWRDHSTILTTLSLDAPTPPPKLRSLRGIIA